MNKQSLSFTYNFDISHLNNNNNNNNSNDRVVENTNQVLYSGNNNHNVFNAPFNYPQYNLSNSQSLNSSNFFQTALNPTSIQSPQSSNPMNFQNFITSPKITLEAPNYNGMIENNQHEASNGMEPSQSSSQQMSSQVARSQSFPYQLNGLGELAMMNGGEEDLNKMDITQMNNYIPKEDENKKEDDDDTSDQKEPTLQNVISTFSLDCTLTLTEIQKKARNTEYNPKRFAALVMRIKQPQTTALIFSSGKVVVTGAKNEKESKLACKKFARIIKKLDYPANFKDFKVQNIVASCEVGYKVSLENLVTSEHANSCRFEPELFPGLIYKMIEPKVTLLIFVSGKIVTFLLIIFNSHPSIYLSQPTK